MKKISLILGISLGTVPLMAQAVQSFDARSLGRGGAGLTMGEFNQALSNPAMVNQFDEDDDFSFAINAGAIASDKDGMLEDLDDTTEDLDDLDFCSDNPAADNCPSIILSAPDTIADNMESLDEKMIQLEAGGAVLIGIPNDLVAMAVSITTRANAGVEFLYDANDRNELREANPANGDANTQDDGNTEFRQEDLRSEVATVGVQITEFGVMAGKTMAVGPLGDVQLGATLKAQEITLFSNTQLIGVYDEDELLDDEFTKEHSAVNVDLGARKVLGDEGLFSVAATIENLIPQSFGAAGTEDFDMNPVLTVAAGVHNGWVKAEAGVDLSERSGFAMFGDTQFAHVGAEFSAGRHAHLRLGYRADMKSNVSDIASVGLGISPYDKVNLDLAAMVGEGDTGGVALQLGFKF